MMRILFDHQVFSFQKYGGISRYFYNLIEQLMHHDQNKLSLFLGFYINQYGLEKYKEDFEKFWGYQRPIIKKTNKFFYLINGLIFKNSFRNVKWDIYHQTYYSYFKTKPHVKRIVTVHDMIHEKYPQFFTKREREQIYRLKGKSLKAADGIICISNRTKNDLLSAYKLEEKKIRVIYHANSLVFELLEERFIKQPYILFVGDRDKYKNFNILLKALGTAENLKNDFILICFGGNRFSSIENRAIMDLGLKDKVFQYSGSDMLLANLYQYTDLFVYPSLYEGFGIPLLEAMHWGCPILSSNGGAMPEILGDAGIKFEPSKMDDLIDKLNSILYNENLKKELVSAGIEREKKFRWDICAAETTAFYEDLVNNS